jgi:hypothetical protein
MRDRRADSVLCDTSCNLCVRDFYDMPYHGVLDWRLGLDMVRLAATGAAILFNGMCSILRSTKTVR